MTRSGPPAALPMTRYRAAWVVPVAAPPIRGGWVDVDRGRVAGVGSADRTAGAAGRREVDLGPRIVLPSLVNAHTHLELSGVRGRIAPAPSMPQWARDLMARTAGAAPDDAAIRRAVAEARRAGTGLVGDVGDTPASVAPLRDAGMPGVVFHELLGFDQREPAELVARARAAIARRRRGDPRRRLAAHAPYSVSPALFRALRAAAAADRLWPLSVHVAESAEEIELLRSGAGAWREILEARGRWDAGWVAGTASPVEYLDRLGWLGPDTLMVHGVHLTDAELARMASAGATLVACPRSNRWTGAGSPPIERFYASGVRVALGTDSLASVADLNLFAELHEARRLGPSTPAADLLRSATQHGAEALGYGASLGAVAPGRRASLIAVACPESVGDVEEYLVSGIEPEQVAWVEW